MPSLSTLRRQGLVAHALGVRAVLQLRHVEVTGFNIAASIWSFIAAICSGVMRVEVHARHARPRRPPCRRPTTTRGLHAGLLMTGDGAERGVAAGLRRHRGRWSSGFAGLQVLGRDLVPSMVKLWTIVPAFAMTSLPFERNRDARRRDHELAQRHLHRTRPGTPVVLLSACAATITAIESEHEREECEAGRGCAGRAAVLTCEQAHLGVPLSMSPRLTVVSSMVGARQTARAEAIRRENRDDWRRSQDLGPDSCPVTCKRGCTVQCVLLAAG